MISPPDPAFGALAGQLRTGCGEFDARRANHRIVTPESGVKVL